jgi:DNA topoisomerase-6 subunit B
MAVIVHVASVWVPYTSESKEAIEPYPEILREIKLALQQCGRELAHYLRREARLHQEFDRRSYIETFLPHIGIALQEILALSDQQRDADMRKLDNTLHASRTTEDVKS